MRRRLGGKQEVPADGAYGLACRLSRREIVAQIIGFRCAYLRAMGCEPAVRGARLAVLLVGTVLRRDELRLQRPPCEACLRHDARSMPGATITAETI